MGLVEEARQARLRVLRMIFEAQSSHIGSNLSCIDILTVLFSQMDPNKDEFIASKGWVAASVYYFLVQEGILPPEALDRYCKEGETKYIGLVEPQGVFGLRAAGGSVGYGLSFGVGFALSRKLKGVPGNVYVLMSDGEMNTGMVHEAALTAAHHKLDNLIVVVDNNGLQATGTTDQVLKTDILDLWSAWGWQCNVVDGHNLEHMSRVFKSTVPGQPLVHVADTFKGKGVSFMEDKLEWHYKNLTDEDYKNARAELCT